MQPEPLRNPNPHPQHIPTPIWPIRRLQITPHQQQRLHNLQRPHIKNTKPQERLCPVKKRIPTMNTALEKGGKLTAQRQDEIENAVKEGVIIIFGAPPESFVLRAEGGFVEPWI